MIPKKYITDYLERALADHRWMKKLKKKEVVALLKRDYPDFDPWPKLRVHQLVACYLGLKYPRFAFYLDMGSGKTLVTLELLRYWYHKGYLRRALVFVISDKAFPTWEKQIKQYEIDVPYVSLDVSNSQDKWRLLESLPEGLVLLHYPGTVAMVAPRGGAKKKGGLSISKPLIKKLIKTTDAVVFDESTRAAGNDSLTNIMCKQLTNPKNVDIVYALAGRPFGRDPTLLWRQQYLVDRGKSLGDTVGLFRAAFFSAKQNPWSKNKHHKKFKFKKRMMRKLTRLAQHRSIMYRSDECVELPKVVPIIEPVRLPEEAGAYYDRVVKEVMAAKGNFKEMKNAFVRMRQLSSGFLGFKNDETGEKAEIAFDENPKLERQLELVESVPSNRKFVIFYEFTFSGRMLYERLKEEGFIVDWLWSGSKNSRSILTNFTEGRTGGLIINNKLGAYSLDGLQIANYQFFYESPVSSLDREQAERRIERQGQLHKVFRYDLVVEDTLDERILEFHKEGRAMHDVLTQSPETLLSKKVLVKRPKRR